jgi:hypothetical protein
MGADAVSRASREKGARIEREMVEAGCAVTTEASPACLWCETPYRPRNSGGREQRFCGERCRRAFHAGVRRWTLGELAAGRLTLADIKNGRPATRASATGAASSLPVAEEGEAACAYLDELAELLEIILDEVSTEEWVKLPDQVVALLDRLFDIHDDRTSGIG